ncbi:MAG: mobile mystery protein B, partial [Candidatus Acidiferrales bacterium]
MFEFQNTAPGNTPLSVDELEGLIPSLSTQQELTEWERENIMIAREWALNTRRIKNTDPLDELYIRELHRRMFSDTWKWAGRYRTTEKNLGVASHLIRERIGVFVGNSRYWVGNKTYEADEIAARSHHELVVIHPFSNGNGRHARLFADVVALKLGRLEFSWGRNEMIAAGPVRDTYLESL